MQKAADVSETSKTFQGDFIYILIVLSEYSIHFA